MNYEQRLLVRQERSRVAIAHEKTARRSHLRTLYGEVMYLGGGQRPQAEQVRSGYPVNHLPES